MSTASSGPITIVTSRDPIHTTDYATSTASVVYRSQGRLVVLGQCARFSELLDAIPQSLRVSIMHSDFLNHDLQDRLSKRNIPCVSEVQDIRISGYLGAFQVEFRARPCSTTQIFTADLVLDLLDPPIMGLSVPPIGYFSNFRSGEELMEQVRQLDDWLGEFEKPRFFSYDPSICAHGSAGISGCGACIEHCGAQAISSESGKVRVNPYLCQGCGDCSTVCPSGAMRYNYPAPEITLNRLRAELGKRGFEPQRPCVVFHDAQFDPSAFAEMQPRNDFSILAYEIESPGAVGIEIWLATLAYGAVAVAILPSQGLLPETRRALDRQIRYANELLAGARLPQAIACVNGLAELQIFVQRLSHASWPKPATFAGLADKRTVLRMAMEVLTQDIESLPESLALSEGAPFGEILVDPERCTLCMACVSICPEAALQDGQHEPRLSFIEANCVQCGICKNGCPETAIQLSPRFMFDGIAARRPRELHRDHPFCCIRCGKAFATNKVIQNITAKLKAHPMFQGARIERLLMCEDCRVKSFFTSNEKGFPR